MTPKNKTVYLCSQCGIESAKWYGKCPSCGEWNTLQEEMVLPKKQISSAGSRVDKAFVQSLNTILPEGEKRCKTGLKELDRVLGGGVVPGGLMLIGGDPGIGKSTLLLQICEHLGKNIKILYVSGEESGRQLKLRADRLNVHSDNLYILCETDVDTILNHIQKEKPGLVIIDSIQTMNLAGLSSAPGSVTQVRECTSAIMHSAKAYDIPVFIVSHVNKDGAIAGPKVMEHIVDCVLYFEGDRNTSYRILRCMKNRYGSTNEIGVFEMRDQGLVEVENPSMMLLSGRPHNVSGTCVACMMEGTRPLLAEVQGLVSPTGFGNPRRMATGFDYNRLSMLLAVLEKRSGFFFSNLDAYINVIGGLRLDEPAADLPVALSLISSLKDQAVKDDVVAFGEIGLAGEIRSVTNIESRIGEAARLGFKKIIMPYHNLKGVSNRSDVELIGVKMIKDAYEAVT
ncbi:MAG: DNA repair protein RadA [Oscillospiraceae bacterium]|nr:DNA repair protein RadA [Oscillospiraceae bacterium]MDD4414266.1 DNA repair protein RadA [Oscillospiraceae bacterium]